MRSRWSRWQEYKRTSPEQQQGPNSAITPTRSGHKGPFIKDLREMLPRSLTQSREGLCVGQSTSVDPGGTKLATTLEGPSQEHNFSEDPSTKPQTRKGPSTKEASLRNKGQPQVPQERIL